MKFKDSILDRLPRPKRDRLSQLRDYVEGLALRAEYYGEGCLRDLNDIVKALDELRDLRAWAHAEISVTDAKPQPKSKNTGRTPQPKRAA